MTKPMCRHCGAKPTSRSRGLCYSCYTTPGLKELYPPTSKYARRGVGIVPGVVPPTPTYATPGSEEKLKVMERRVAQGLSPFHPLDERIDIPSWLGRTARLNCEQDSGV